MNTTDLIQEINIAEKLDEKKLLEIANDCHTGFESDLSSRSTWEERLEEWTRLALQVREEKTYPWPKASNVKYPLLTTASMQFAARAYPSLIPNDGRVVKCKVIGSDPQGLKQARADRLSVFHSYQVMNEMPDWEEEMDRLLMILPIIGCIFKKTYFDPLLETNVSNIVYPKDFVINYWTRSIETSSRYTQIYRMTKNDVKERVNKGIFLDQDLGQPIVDNITDSEGTDSTELRPDQSDETTPYLILEQHCWIDLDDDGYREPYVVTFERNSKKILRIVARFNENSIITGDDGKLVRIVPIQYYTKYSFIPNPEGGFYDIGFGLLLGSINESVNTLVNQLVDAGSLSNLQSGFLAKGLRLKLGEARFQPGEWKFVNATGDDLKKSIFPLPVREPSNVLFQLLGMLITSGKELASVAEIFVGKMPGQNTPATTTQSTIEQGMKVFTAIFKRVYRSLTKEFTKLYKLNADYYDKQKYIQIVEDQTGQAMNDFSGPADDIVPAADPQATSDVEKINKAGAIMNLIQMGTVNPQEATRRFLEANGISDLQTLMQVQPPPPDPKVQEMQMKMQMEQQKHQADMQGKQVDLQIQQQIAQLQMEVEQAKLELERAKLEIELQRAHMDIKVSEAQAQQKIQQDAMSHQQKMEQADANHKQKLTQSQEKSE